MENEEKYQNEQWKEIPMELYKRTESFQASTFGRIRKVNTKSKKIITPYSGSNSDQMYVDLFWSSQSFGTSVHKLVAQTFIPNPNDYNTIHHIDNDPSNNRPDNLIWVTRKHSGWLRSKNKFMVDIVNHGKYEKRIFGEKDFALYLGYKTLGKKIDYLLKNNANEISDNHYIISHSVAEYFKKSNSPKVSSLGNSSGYKNAKGKGKNQIWVLSLGADELAELKLDIEELSTRKFKAKYDRTLVTVRKAVEALENKEVA